MSQIERNEFGHTMLRVVGLNLTGKEEAKRLHEAGYDVDDRAWACLTNQRSDGYDGRHRLADGQPCKVALMPHSLINRDEERTSAALYKIATDRFGYQLIPAGAMPRVCETMSIENMRAMGAPFIAGQHLHLKHLGTPYALVIDIKNNKVVMTAVCVGNAAWQNEGVSAFLSL